MPNPVNYDISCSIHGHLCQDTVSSENMLFLLLLFTTSVSSQEEHLHQKPVILKEITSQTVKSGERLVLKCSATGTPAPVVVINRKEEGHRGLYFPEPHKDEAGTGRAKRIFKSITPSDEGWYICIALNLRSIAVSEAYITVEDPCESVTCSPPKTCVAGECTCERACVETYSPVCGSDCLTYFNRCLMEQDACNENLSLTVLHTGLCNGKIRSPSISLRRREVDLVPGEGAVLSATVTGYPQPTVTWYKILDRFLHSHTKVGEGASLRVFEEGVYFGEAVNCLTSRVKSAMVTVSEVEVTKTPTEEIVTDVVKTTGMVTEEMTSEELLVTVTETPPLTTEMSPDDLEELPKLEDMRSCTMVGGSHVSTFDGWTYGFQGFCTYVLAMDCFFASWYVYVRYMECDTGRCLDVVDIIDNGHHIALSRGWAINDNGKKFQYKPNKAFVVNGVTGILQDDQLTISLKDKVYIRFDGYSLVQIFVADDAKTCGLCGNNDGIKSNDVENGRKRYQTAPEVVDFAESWKLRSDRRCSSTSPSDKPVSNTCSKDPIRLQTLRDCRKLFKLDISDNCISNKDVKFLYEACRYDACYGEYPLKGYSNVCYSGRAIANLCGEGRGDRDWEEVLRCGTPEERREAIFSVGCPYSLIE